VVATGGSIDIVSVPASASALSNALPTGTTAADAATQQPIVSKLEVPQTALRSIRALIEPLAPSETRRFVAETHG
jgi:hypothetical protein